MTDPSKTDPTRLCPGCFRVELPEGTCERCGFDRAQASSPTTLPVGAVLAGKYLIGRVLGSPGGFGITYLGWNLHLQTRVAIKEFMPRDLVARSNSRYEIVPHTGDDHESFVYGLGKFLEEARTLAKFDHRNVVQVSDYFEENGTAYLVMKYYDGAPLSDYVAAQGGTIPLDVAVQIFLPVLDALEDVHARGFLHRDIKPSNIYLTDKGRPILLDFGASRQAMSERSRSLSAVLTPGYAPFEQYHRRGRQGPWTDIYACAATFYRVVVGVAPPEANSRMAGEELRAPHEVVEGMSRSMSEGILRALEVRAADRLQTVAELEDVLRDRWDPSAPRAPQGAWAEAEGTGSGHARPGSADTPDASSHSGPARQPGSADADTQPVGAGAAAWNDPTRPVNRAAGSVPFDATRPLHGAGGPPAGGSGGGDDGGKGDDAGGGAG
ncbi:MAG: serine/threonine protein kinase, partial [Gemmatimonadetes bacterium]